MVVGEGDHRLKPVATKRLLQRPELESQLRGKMRCSKCGFDNPGGMKFCGQCTTPLALMCPNCQFENPPGFKFCGQCTTALGSDSAKPKSSNPQTSIPEADGPAALDGERKLVTALFADIKGSMELLEDL